MRLLSSDWDDSKEEGRRNHPIGCRPPSTGMNWFRFVLAGETDPGLRDGKGYWVQRENVIYKNAYEETGKTKKFVPVMGYLDAPRTV